MRFELRTSALAGESANHYTMNSYLIREPLNEINILNFRISDSMSDFILIIIIEFSINNYIFHIL